MDITLVDFAVPDTPGQDSYSPFVMKVARLLHLVGLPYKRHVVGSPFELRRLNPTQQIPVVHLGEERIVDSTRIARRVQTITGHSLGGPEDWLWEELADSSLYGMALAARWVDDETYVKVRDSYFRALPVGVRSIVASSLRRKILASLHGRDVTRSGLASCWERFKWMLDDLEGRAPETGFWTSPVPTIADVSMFAMLHALRTPITPIQAEWLSERRRLTAWLDRVDVATRGAPISG